MRRREMISGMLGAAAGLGLGRGGALGQVLGQAAPRHVRPAPVPFGIGEQATYQVKLGAITAGEGRLAVTGVEDVRGRPCYSLLMELEGGVVFFKVDDQIRSWVDVETLASRRYTRDINQTTYDPPIRTFEIYPEERRWERLDNDDEGPTLSSLPLDELAFIYYTRSQPLALSDTYTWNRYFKEDGNPVIVSVVRKDRREVPAGVFDTIVVAPRIPADNLFDEKRQAEIHFSDDDARHLVYLRSEIPVVGSITMHLTSVREGTPHTPGR